MKLYKPDHIDLSICIVNWNSRDVLQHCLKSIYDFSDDIVIEIIVVDNNSSDNSCQMIENNYSKVVLIKNDKNIGFGKANNIALTKCRGEYILILNPDIIIRQNSLKEMMDFLYSNSSIGCIGCKLLNLDGSIEDSYYTYFPTPSSELKERLLINRFIKKDNRNIAFEKKPIRVSWIVGACMMFQKEVLILMGGFDEQYFMYSEDADLCFRLIKNDYQIFYLPYIEMLHYKAYSSDRQSKSYFSTVLQKESRYRFMHKNYGFMKAILYRLICFASGLVRLCILSLLLSFSTLFFRVKKKDFMFLFVRYLRVMLWSLGYENWTKVWHE